MRSRETGFADETDLASVIPDDPATEPDYWLETYPILMESLAVAGYGGEDAPQDVALEMAILVTSHSSGGIRPSDSNALDMYVKDHVAVG